MVSDPSRLRIGRVEQVVLDELMRVDTLTPREAVVRLAYPSLTPTGRSSAEAAVSRAIRSLEQKGLVVRERNPRTGRTWVRAPGASALPRWEQLARAEEDLAAHCRLRASEWLRLASHADGRAALL